jgi:hypothetical protein
MGRPRGRWPVRFLVALTVLVTAGIMISVAVNQSGHETDRGFSPRLQPRPSVPAAVPGWVAVVDSDRKLAYDVPADWHVSYLGDGQLLSTSDWSMSLGMTASYLDGYCESARSSFRAQSGMTMVESADTTAAATDTAKEVADAAYGPVDSHAGAAPTVTLSSPRSMPGGTLVTAQVKVNKPGTCEPQTALVDVFALPTADKHRSVVVVAFADEQFTGAISQHDLDTIVISFRGLSAH